MQRVKLHWVLLVAFLGVLVLGVTGFLLTPGYAEGGSFGNRLASAVYQALQLFVLEAPSPDRPVRWWTHVARFGAILVTYVAVVGGVLWLARDRMWRIRARFKRDHAVVGGLGDKGFRLLRGLRAAGIPVVAIERDEGNANIDSAQDLGAIVLPGDARDPVALSRAGVKRAKFLIACCGTDDTNAEVIIQARELVDDSGPRVLRCVAHITDPQLCRLLQEQQLRSPGADRFRLEFFNIYRNGARVLLDEHPPFRVEAPTDGGTPPAEAPHVVVIGLGALGEEVVTGIAWRWARARADSANRVRISVYAPDSERRAAVLCACFPALTASAELALHDIDPAKPAFEAGALLADGRAPSAAYVCMDDDPACLEAGLSFFTATREARIPVVVCMMGVDGVAALLGSVTGIAYGALRGFPVLERTCTTDIVFGLIARTIHQKYIDNAARDGRAPGSEPSLLPWDELPEHLRESNRRQADDMARKLEAAGYGVVPLERWGAEPDQLTTEEIEALARLEHARWVGDRKRLGWRPGPEKDVARKRTPYLVGWDELSEDVKELDRNAVREIPELLASLQLGIYRRTDR